MFVVCASCKDVCCAFVVFVVSVARWYVLFVVGRCDLLFVDWWVLRCVCCTVTVGVCLLVVVCRLLFGVLLCPRSSCVVFLFVVWCLLFGFG